MRTGDINGVGVGVIALGAVMTYAGFRNVTLLEAFKSLAMGKAPTPNPKAPWTDVQMSLSDLQGIETNPFLAGSGTNIVAMARTVAQSPAGRANYCWGGGHTASPCSARCFDCSGYVSCVLNRLGLMKGSKVTGDFMVWSGAVTIPYAQRQPGDLVVSAGHMGIIVDNQNMINAACTKCGPVKISPYAGRRGYIVRRVKQAGASTAPRSGLPPVVAV